MCVGGGAVERLEEIIKAVERLEAIMKAVEKLEAILKAVERLEKENTIRWTHKTDLFNSKTPLCRYFFFSFAPPGRYLHHLC